MADILTPEARSARMSLIRGKNTKPELVVRRLIHAMGYRYRLHQKDLPGRPDLVFRSKRKVIFVHGCFWHGHPRCRMGKLPKSNRKFWIKKIRANQRRDKLAEKQLEGASWRVLIMWQCQLRQIETVRQQLDGFLSAYD